MVLFMTQRTSSSIRASFTKFTRFFVERVPPAIVFKEKANGTDLAGLILIRHHSGFYPITQQVLSITTISLQLDLI